MNYRLCHEQYYCVMITILYLYSWSCVLVKDHISLKSNRVSTGKDCSKQCTVATECAVVELSTE